MKLKVINSFKHRKPALKAGFPEIYISESVYDTNSNLAFSVLIAT